MSQLLTHNHVLPHSHHYSKHIFSIAKIPILLWSTLFHISFKISLCFTKHIWIPMYLCQSLLYITQFNRILACLHHISIMYASFPNHFPHCKQNLAFLFMNNILHVTPKSPHIYECPYTYVMSLIPFHFYKIHYTCFY